jgi:hypothetical protein
MKFAVMLGGRSEVLWKWNKVSLPEHGIILHQACTKFSNYPEWILHWAK